MEPIRCSPNGVGVFLIVTCWPGLQIGCINHTEHPEAYFFICMHEKKIFWKKYSSDTWQKNAHPGSRLSTSGKLCEWRHPVHSFQMAQPRYTKFLFLPCDETNETQPTRVAEGTASSSNIRTFASLI